MQRNNATNVLLWILSELKQNFIEVFKSIVIKTGTSLPISDACDADETELSI